jgi:hypothetical protein
VIVLSRLKGDWTDREVEQVADRFLGMVLSGDDGEINVLCLSDCLSESAYRKLGVSFDDEDEDEE